MASPGFGFSVGDFIKAIELIHKAYTSLQFKMLVAARKSMNWSSLIYNDWNPCSRNSGMGPGVRAKVMLVI